MASTCVTLHEAEEMCDCLCVYRSWLAVRDAEIKDGPREQELYRELYMFPETLRREAERMSR